MRIVYHLGAHCTDEERLLRCLVANQPRLAEEGIVVPDPALYRSLLRDTAVTLKGTTTSPESQALVLTQILGGEPARRMILSWENFLAYPQWVLRGGLYPQAGDRVRALADIFPDHETEVHLGIRNPATFLPALFQKQRNRSYEEFIEGTDPGALRWSEMIEGILSAAPGLPLTVWCDEDTPLIWPEVLVAVSGHAGAAGFEGADDLLASLMSATGLRRMRRFLSEHAPDSPERRRRVVSAFLDKFAQPERMEMDIELPDWTEELIDDLTRRYDEDVARIQALPGVTFLAP